MAAAGKRGLEEDIDQGRGALFVQIAGTEGEDVGVIVFADEADFVLGIGRSGADAFDLVGGDGHADAGGADEHAAVEVAPGDFAGDGLGEIGIVAGFGGISAEIHDFVAFAGEAQAEFLLKGETGVICANRNFHIRGEKGNFSMGGGGTPMERREETLVGRTKATPGGLRRQALETILPGGVHQTHSDAKLKAVRGCIVLRLSLLALSVLILASAQDQSRAIQAQQQREAEERGEQQRRELIRQERQRETQSREEQELAARRRAEAEAEEQRQRQQTVTESPQRPQQPEPTPIRDPQTTADSNGAEPVNSGNVALRVIGMSIMAICALSILGILIHYRVTRS
jgi:hypothetical protein